MFHASLCPAMFELLTRTKQTEPGFHTAQNFNFWPLHLHLLRSRIVGVHHHSSLCSTGDWTWGVFYAKQVLYLLIHTPRPYSLHAVTHHPTASSLGLALCLRLTRRCLLVTTYAIGPSCGPWGMQATPLSASPNSAVHSIESYTVGPASSLHTWSSMYPLVSPRWGRSQDSEETPCIWHLGPTHLPPGQTSRTRGNAASGEQLFNPRL